MTKKILKNTVLWAYWYPLRSFVNTLPVPMMYRFAALFGDLHRNLSRKKRHCLRAEYRFLAEHAAPGDTPERTVRKSFVQHFQNDFEMFRYGQITTDNLEQFIICKGLKHLEQAVAEQRGVMLSLGHFGANKMIMAAIGHRGYPMNQFSTPPQSGSKNE